MAPMRPAPMRRTATDDHVRRNSPRKNGYVPMQKQGSLILGTGGDNTDADGGERLRGAVATGPLCDADDP